MSAAPDRDDDALLEIAGGWLTQRDEGFTPEQAREFDRWCRADPAHAAAIAQLEQTWALLEKLPFAAERLDAPTPTTEPENIFPLPAAPEKSAPRRRWPAIAIALAAAAAVAFAAVWWTDAGGTGRAEAETVYATSGGGYERVLLADGSTLELNADSEARVRITARERRVALTAGEAHFSVAPDAARPFVVAAGGVAVRAVGTAFNVRLAPAGVEVLVTEGKVRVAPEAAVAASREAKTPSSTTLLRAGERVLMPPEPAAAPPPIEFVAPEAIQRALAWQEHQLRFVDTPLHEVVAQFNRRNTTQLVLADPALAGRRVGGAFAVGNVEAFVRLLESSGDIRAERRPSGEIALHRAP